VTVRISTCVIMLYGALMVTLGLASLLWRQTEFPVYELTSHLFGVLFGLLMLLSPLSIINKQRGDRE
jgi:hypothetical protein